MFCSKCGVAVDNDAKFCANCGTKQVEQQFKLPAGIQTTDTHTSHLSNNPLNNDQKKAGFGVSGGVIFSLVLVFIFGMLYEVGIVSETSKASVSFKKTNAGQALYSCVSSSGNINISDFKLDSGAQAVNVKLIKSKTIELQFSVDSELNQAMLIGARLPGEDKVSKIELMLNLETMCGGKLSSQIMPDEYNALSIMNGMTR